MQHLYSCNIYTLFNIKEQEKPNNINNLENHLVSLYKSQVHKAEITRVESEIEFFYNEKAIGPQIRSMFNYIEKYLLT